MARDEASSGFSALTNMLRGQTTWSSRSTGAAGRAKGRTASFMELPHGYGRERWDRFQASAKGPPLGVWRGSFARDGSPADLRRIALSRSAARYVPSQHVPGR